MIPEQWKSEVVACSSQHIATAWAKAYAIVWKETDAPDIRAERGFPGTAQAPRTTRRRSASELVEQEWLSPLWPFRILQALGCARMILDDPELGIAQLRTLPATYEDEANRAIIVKANEDEEYRDFLLGVIALGGGDQQIAEAARRGLR